YQIINDFEGRECLVRSIQFFKILSMLFGGITCNDAQKIESILNEEFEKIKIQAVESDKLWEHYFLYIQKLNNIMIKGGARKAHTVGESSKKRTVNSKRRRRTSDSRRNTKDHLVDSNSENQENNEGFAISAVCKPRSNNISPSFGDEDVNNSFNSERSSPNMKRSAPVDDIEITKSPAKKRKSYAKKRSSVEMGDVSNEEKPDNEGSDSDGSYQSLSD
ncbi:11015_t:CDS:2, partial [Racocetra persica]